MDNQVPLHLARSTYQNVNILGRSIVSCVSIKIGCHLKAPFHLSNPSEAELQHLSEACQPATFGLNKENVHDESYQKAIQMDSSNFAIKFAAMDSSLMDVVCSELLKCHERKKALKAELYKLNVYSEAYQPCVTCLFKVLLRPRGILQTPQGYTLQ